MRCLRSPGPHSTLHEEGLGRETCTEYNISPEARQGGRQVGHGPELRVPRVKYSARNYRPRGGGGGQRPSGSRLTVQIYYDILRAVDVLVRGGKKATMYGVGRLASLPHGRLKARLGELRELG